MLPAFNMLAASILALVWLTVGLLFPILAVWFGVHVARSLRRLAEANEKALVYSARITSGVEESKAIMQDFDAGTVKYSAFGR